jgi:hypothetical protein
MERTPKLVIEFPDGVGKKPVAYPCADSDEDAAALRKYADRLEKKRENKKEKNDK